jgi:hypothetical protein
MAKILMVNLAYGQLPAPSMRNGSLSVSAIGCATAGWTNSEPTSVTTLRGMGGASSHAYVVRNVPFMPFGKIPPPVTPALSVRYTMRRTCCGVRVNALPSGSDGTMFAFPSIRIP